MIQHQATHITGHHHGADQGADNTIHAPTKIKGCVSAATPGPTRHAQWDFHPTPCQSKVEGDCGQSSECSVQPQWSTSSWAKKMKRGKGNSWERRGSQRDGGGVAYTRTGAGWAVWADCQCPVKLDQWCRGWRLTHSPLQAVLPNLTDGR